MTETRRCGADHLRISNLSTLVALTCAAITLPFSNSAARAELSETSTYLCASGASFTVRQDAENILVTLPTRELIMRAKPSNLGRKYVSAAGTLIIDESFATLVFDDDLRFMSCTADRREGNFKSTIRRDRTDTAQHADRTRLPPA